MDPNHRSCIAFVKICSGKFERNANYKHIRSGKMMKFAAPTAFMAQKKNIVDEAFPGDIVGIPDTGNFKIGDTLTAGEQLHFKGLPSFSPEMFKYIKEEDYDSVATRRVTRKGEPPIRSFFARMFYKIINRISKADIVDGARDYRLMTRQMVDSILELKEYNRFSKGIFSWVGYNTKWLEYKNVERVAGTTKWSFWKLFLYSLDGIVAFSTTPLSIASV